MASDRQGDDVDGGVDRDEIVHPDRPCLFISEETTGVESEFVEEYDDRTFVKCEGTRDAVIKSVNAVKSRAKLCQEHAEHFVEGGDWEYVSQQKKLVTDGGVDQSGDEVDRDAC